ncbi:hypothetical protein FACS1894110_18470 [Spirochaetia bacterium]|nr:hypothetical protein FACS1894110_18470 [Spirochaetia bacterium]
MAQNKFAEIIEKQFGGSLFDKSGNPVTFDEVAISELMKHALPNKKAGKESDPAWLAKLVTMKSKDEADPELTELKKQDMAAHTRKLEIDNAKEEGKLIEQHFGNQLFTEICSALRSILIAAAPVTADSIAAAVGVKNDERILKIQEIIEDDDYKVIGTVKRKVSDWIKAFGGEPLPDNGEDKPPARKQKSKRKVK